MHDLTSIRPRLKQNVVILSTDEGVLFQSDDATFRLKGASVAEWMSQLRPYLTGEYTLDTLCDRLAPTPRATVIRLVEALLHKGVLTNVLSEAPGLLPAAVLQHFRPQIAFIDHFVDHPQQRFKTFRESRLLLVGSGEAFSWLALSLIRNGLKQVFLAATDGTDEYVEALTPEIDQMHERGCDVLLSTVDGTLADLGDYDLVIFCSDRASLREVATLHLRCVQEGRLFLPAFVFAGRAIIGPFVRPPGRLCWLCAMMRLSANSNERHRAALWSTMTMGLDLGSRHDAVFSPVARRMGNGAAFELFKILSETLSAETEGGVMFQDLDTLESWRATLLPHPLCPVCSHFGLDTGRKHLEALVTGQHDHHLTHEDLLQHCTLLFDSSLGVFNQFADGDLLQLPLKGTRLLAGSPVSSLTESIDVTAYHLENVLEARYTALLEAVSIYSQRLPDVRGMIWASQEELSAEGKDAIAPQALSTWSGTASLEQHVRIHWLPAWSLFRQCLCYVPAAAVYSQSSLNGLGSLEGTSAGSAVGLTFQELLTAGMCSALGYDLLRQLMHGQCAVLDLDPVMVASSSTDLTFLLKSTGRFERPFALLEVVHDAPLSVMIARMVDASETPLVTIGIGLSGMEATTRALLGFVGNLQHLQAAGSLLVSREALFPGFSPSADFVRAHPEASRFHQPAATSDQLATFLQASGREVLFVNTTPPDLWEAAPLLSGTVLLAQTAHREDRPEDRSEERL